MNQRTSNPSVQGCVIKKCSLGTINESSTEVVLSKVLKPTSSTVKMPARFQARSHSTKNQKRKAKFALKEDVSDMEIVEEKWPPKGLTGKSCYNCGQFGHYARQCRKGEPQDPIVISSDEDSDEDEVEKYTKEQSLYKACSKCGEIGHHASECNASCPRCTEDHPLGKCPTGKITCYLCQGIDHVPKDCHMNLLLTKITKVQRTSFHLAHQYTIYGHASNKDNPSRSQPYSTLKPSDKTLKRNRQRNIVVCYNCREKGHYSNECPKPKNVVKEALIKSVQFKKTVLKPSV